MPARRLLVLSLLALACSSPPPAPEDESALPPELEQALRAEKRDAALRLKLTPEQIGEARPIIRKSMQRRWQVVQGYKDAPRNLITLTKVKRELRVVNREAEQELSKVLRPEQLEEYRKILEELRDKAIAEYERRSAEAAQASEEPESARGSGTVS